MSAIVNLSRRDFIKTGMAVGGGLILGFSLHPADYLAGAAQPSTTTFAPNAFIRIGADGLVTILVNHSEMGQGVYTALPTLVAEELEADWSNMRVEAAPVDPAYNHTQYGMQMTGGSTSTWSEWERLRQAGATARMMLIAAAAQAWNVDPASCRAENGFIIHAPSRRQLSYGELAERAAHLTPPQNAPLKDPKDFKLIGKPIKRLDTPEKINGTAVFGLDVNVPGMLTAVVARPPVFGGTVKNVDASRAQTMPDVRHVVEIDRGVAVVADGYWSLRKAARPCRSHGTKGRLPGSIAGSSVKSTQHSPNSQGPWPEKKGMWPPPWAAPRRNSKRCMSCPTLLTPRWNHSTVSPMYVLTAATSGPARSSKPSIVWPRHKSPDSNPNRSTSTPHC